MTSFICSCQLRCLSILIPSSFTDSSISSGILLNVRLDLCESMLCILDNLLDEHIIYFVLTELAASELLPDQDDNECKWFLISSLGNTYIFGVTRFVDGGIVCILDGISCNCILKVIYIKIE